MKTISKTITLLTLMSSVAFVTPAFAQTQNDEAVKSDVDNLNKDNQDIKNNQADTARNQNAQAADKANGSYGKEAVDATKVGGDKVVGATDSVKKSIHKKSLNHHKKKAAEGSSSSGTSNATGSSSSANQ